MLRVFIWSYRGMDVAWGHASVLIGGKTYVSWWPQDSGRQVKIPGAPGFMRNLYSVNAILGRTYKDDVRDEGQPPDHIIDIAGLDEAAAEKYWNDLIRAANPQWTTLGMNCSTTVAEVLKAAGGDELASGLSGWWHSWNTVWKPDDVLAYARAIVEGSSS